MKDTIRINAKAVVNDIKAGMPDSAIIEKYGLSESLLSKLYDKLLKKNLIKKDDLKSSSVTPNSDINLDEIVDEADRSQFESLAQEVMLDLAHGKPKSSIIRRLKKLGWNSEEAACFVDNVEHILANDSESAIGRQAIAHKFSEKMLYGFLWVFGGVIVSLITYMSAALAENGGTYVLAWGAILWGVFDFFRGLFGWLKYRN